jgi:outer membrane protein OmpA-like peptidoglycan-associated protein
MLHRVIPSVTPAWALLLGCLSLLSHGAGAAVVEPDLYMAGEHESVWEFNGSSAKCELRHEIPRFGTARFLRLAGEELSFKVDSFQPVPEPVEALLREESPAWEHAEPDPLTQPVQVRQGLRPLELERKPSAWLLASLAKGQVGSFDFRDWDDNRKTVHLRLSPVNYQKPYREFRRCLKSLAAMGFEEYRNSEVRFALDVHELDKNERLFLDTMAQFIIADESISEVQIEGHADDQGTRRYNRKLSSRRANSVYQYLQAAGVEARLMSRRGHGESRPKIRSRSETARAANRRVEILLLR